MLETKYAEGHRPPVPIEQEGAATAFRLSVMLNDVHALENGLLIHGQEVVMTFGQCLAESFHHTLGRHDRMKLEVTSEHKHVEALHHLHFSSGLHGMEMP